MSDLLLLLVRASDAWGPTGSRYVPVGQGAKPLPQRRGSHVGKMLILCGEPSQESWRQLGEGVRAAAGRELTARLQAAAGRGAGGSCLDPAA